MKKFILIIVILLWCSSLKSQELKFYPIQKDYPNSQNVSYFKYSIFKYDKARHLMLHTALVLVNPVKKYNIDLWSSIAFGLAYETFYDGYDWKRSGGFSWVDLIFDVAGSVVGVWLKDLCHSKGIYVLVNRNGISFNF